MAVVAADIWRDTRWRERPQSFASGIEFFLDLPPVGAEFNRCCHLASSFGVCINKVLLKLGVTRGPPHTYRHICTHTHTYTHTPLHQSQRLKATHSPSAGHCLHPGNTKAPPPSLLFTQEPRPCTHFSSSHYLLFPHLGCILHSLLEQVRF